MIHVIDLIAAGAHLAQAGDQIQWSGWAYDSRLARTGDLFIALQTARADGHGFIRDAIAAGATGIVCQYAPSVIPAAISVLTCDDPLSLLRRWAKAQFAKHAPRTVAITGSVGKTSTKRAVAHVLASRYAVLRSPRSFNADLGLSVTMAELAAQQWAVLEFGADHPGEISQLCQLFPPEIGIVTNVGSAHFGAFGSQAAIAHEKAAIIQQLPAHGYAILNGDDPLVAAMAEQTHARLLRVGQNAACEIRWSDVTSTVQTTRFTIHIPEHAPERIQLSASGVPSVQAAAFALAVGYVAGLSLAEMQAALANLTPAHGRFNPLAGRNGAIIIDDTFNAAPESVYAALQTLGSLPARRRIAILGDMAELGAASPHFHQQVGQTAAEHVDLLITKGDQAALAANRARELSLTNGYHINTISVHSAAAALAAVPSDLGAGDLVLVKGAAEARMEHVVAGLLAAASDPRQVLVRQEHVWRNVRIGLPDRPTTVRIDLDALAANVQAIRQAAGVPLMAVLKADAYGHGAVRSARTVLLHGASELAVATLGEALHLRQADIAAPILILGYTPAWQMREVLLNRISVALFDRHVAQSLHEQASALGIKAQVHIKIDTGMARLGLAIEQAVDFIAWLNSLAGIEVVGIFTHFANADEADASFFELQQQRFQQVLDQLTARGLRPPVVHAANSAAAMAHPSARYDMVRAGIGLYGIDPSSDVRLGLQPVLEFQTEVAQVRQLAAGSPISYGCTFVTKRPSQIATIPVGYADGFRRAPQPWREVLIHGRRVPVVGRVCMDYAMIDVTELEHVQRGDQVVLIGQQGADRIRAEEVAAWLGTNAYEVVSAILPRVPREPVEHFAER
ncbi:alanine racemase [Herpetosiphon llansteffanensis]|uniref:alanine racemase n=1 Tax=Herpetosiphon llansteffanensis TaxID=2094568 RepID=UPI000D7C9484|nr:alanine racemase [Herpetosiphon llansteffanensis]